MRQLALALWWFTGATPAFSMDTASIVAACESPPGTAAAGLCNAYINGVAEGILADQVAREQGQAICFPDSFPGAAVRDAILAYVNNKNAAILMLPSGGVVAAALQAAYPCRP